MGLKVQMAYFDKSVIKRNWKRINRGPLQKAGNIVRMNARQSIRRVGPKAPPSPVGQPPRSRQGGKTPPFKMIYSVPQHMGTSVVVGMVWLGSNPAVPGLEEHGGVAPRVLFVPQGRRQLKKGGLGAVVRKKTRAMAHYPERPFMRPALKKALPRLPLLWKNSVSKPQ